MIAGRAELIGIFDNHLKHRGFCSDMQPLLRTDITYDPQTAGKYVKTHLLNLSRLNCSIRRSEDLKIGQELAKHIFGAKW